MSLKPIASCLAARTNPPEVLHHQLFLGNRLFLPLLHTANPQHAELLLNWLGARP